MKVEFVVFTLRLRRFSLAGQLLVAQWVILLTVLIAVSFVALAQSEATFSRTEGRRIFAISELVASTPLVRTQMSQPDAVAGMAAIVQGAVTQYGVTSISLADPDGVVRVSSDPTLEGRPIPHGSPEVARGASWTGIIEVGGGRTLVAETPILADSTQTVGDRLGTVVVATALPSVLDRLRGASSFLLTYLGIALALGGLGSWLLARWIKRQTLGLEPREITGLAESREAMLFGIAEGVIALDVSNRVTLVNNVARRLLDLPERTVGMSLNDLMISSRLRDVLLGVSDEPEEPGGTAEGRRNGIHADGKSSAGPRDQVVLRRGRVLVMNRMEVRKDGRRLGSVTTLRDRTELADLERELGAFRSTTDVLRAQAHEFANQLHTISGLIQLGEYDEVVRFVDSVSEHRTQLDLALSRQIGDTAIRALVMAKVAQAAERRVELRVSPTTSLGRLTPRDSADVATVVGNLVDNGIDATVAGETPGGARWVELEIRQDSTTVEIVVGDSGPGVAPELVTEVFAHGFTTKVAQAGERGIGLALTRLTCQRHGGEVSLENTPDGARFAARLTVETPGNTASDTPVTTPAPRAR